MTRTDNNLQFIREKIYEARSAIMYSQSDGIVKMPNNIVTALDVDDEGQLWFLCTPPAHQVQECEQTFPAQLHFYRKGINFFLDISGKATIMNPASDSILGKQSIKSVLLKMNMYNVEYVEPDEKKKKTKVEAAIETGYNWLLKTVAIPRHDKPVLSKLPQSSI